MSLAKHYRLVTTGLTPSFCSSKDMSGLSLTVHLLVGRQLNTPPNHYKALQLFLPVFGQKSSYRRWAFATDMIDLSRASSSTDGCRVDACARLRRLLQLLRFRRRPYPFKYHDDANIITFVAYYSLVARKLEARQSYRECTSTPIPSATGAGLASDISV